METECPKCAEYKKIIELAREVVMDANDTGCEKCFVVGEDLIMALDEALNELEAQ